MDNERPQQQPPQQPQQRISGFARLYSIIFLVQGPDGAGNVGCSTVLAISPEQAMEMAKRIAAQSYPPLRGWGVPQIQMQPIPDDLVKAAAAELLQAGAEARQVLFRAQEQQPKVIVPVRGV